MAWYLIKHRDIFTFTDIASIYVEILVALSHFKHLITLLIWVLWPDSTQDQFWDKTIYKNCGTPARNKTPTIYVWLVSCFTMLFQLQLYTMSNKIDEGP
jgi:hypothetical protein